MTLYPTVWPLPYGVTIPTVHSPEHYYSIPRSQTQCWELKLDDFKQVIIVGMHSGIEGNQYGTISAWLSMDPNGPNLIPPIAGVPSNIHLGTIGNRWCFYVAGHQPISDDAIDVRWIIEPSRLYYFNVRNLENKDNSYYLRFTYGDGDATVVA